MLPETGPWIIYTVDEAADNAAECRAERVLLDQLVRYVLTLDRPLEDWEIDAVLAVDPR